MNAVPLAQVETPAVLVDRERLLRNIDAAQSLADRNGVRLRPHIKTHKCVEIARLQLARGAVGLTASKTDEAMVFVEAGFQSVTVAYPIVADGKLERLLGAVQRHSTDLRVVVDNAAAVEVLGRLASRLGVEVGVFLEIDVGLHRCGVREDALELLDLVRLIARRELRFCGLLSHAGHAYGAANRAEVGAIAAEEREILARIRARLESSGIAVPEISVGSTPTVLASESFDDLTEIRPGNYVFLDRTPVRLGLAGIEDVALTVLTAVVSRNADYLIVDAGSKVLSSDLGAHGTSGAGGYGLAYCVDEELTGSAALTVAKLSEEHGFIERGVTDLPVGAKLRIVPNHACPVANLADELVVVSGGQQVDTWRVDARGKVR